MTPEPGRRARPARAGRRALLQLAFALAAAAPVAGSLRAAEPTAQRAEGEHSPTAKPAQLENAVPEAALSTVRLTPEAIERTGIEVTTVERRSAPRTRMLGGVVVAVPGGSVTVFAPQQGALLAPQGTGIPLPGTRVRRGEPLLRLLPLSSGELARARDVAQVAEARVAVAEEAAARDDAETSTATELAAAREALRAARARMRVLAGDGGDEATVRALAPLSIAAPADGVVQDLRVSAGQTVPAGAVLLELVRTDPVWIRTAVYAGDVARVRADASAQVRALGAPAASSRPAEPVPGPPSADPASASVDLYFALPNPQRELRPGQIVEVTLTLEGSENALAVPRSALLYDVHGDSWVYERVGELAFARRRVEVAFVSADAVFLTRGPEPGAAVVSAGAAELFGVEFGPGGGH